MKPAVLRAVLVISVLAAFDKVFPAQAQTANTSLLATVRDVDQSVACTIARPATSLVFAQGQDADQLVILLRVPAAPSATGLARLAPSARDFSSLPIDVFVVPVPQAGTTKAAQLRRSTALLVDPTLTRATIDSQPSRDLFVRAILPRDVVVADVDVVAERKVKTSDGAVATQTRCRIRATDAAKWR
jgi:hypothetical protein